MTSADSGYTATDIITYIGVPLAVLGVLPILYNTAATLTSLSKIKRMLRHSRLTALTRSDVVNRVIEVELPRYAVRPWDRFDHRAEYWALSGHPSSIPGGSWTTFNWRSQIVGLKTQRVEYADQLRQPQVDAALDELVCYLLDLGAVPDPHGWRLLRSTGLWTPVGCALMMSPDGREKALTIAPLDDSDGHLSLAVHWSPQWTTRDYSHLPPYWVRLPPSPEHSREQGEASNSEKGVDDAVSPVGGESSSTRKESLDSAQHEAESNAKRHITCQISVDGIVTALTQEDRLQSNLKLDSLYIEHIRIRPSKSAGVWFASAATAYGTTSQTVLWNYKIPDDVLSFARKETVPCGVLELLGVVNDDDTPEWATRHDADHATALDLHVQRHNEQRAAMAAEARMAPAQREAAARERVMRENEQRMRDMRERMRRDVQRKDARLMEAFQSPRWDTKRVAEYCLAWLKCRGHVAPEVSGIKDVVGMLLHRMVLDGQFTAKFCGILDLWKAWADNGGMRKSDFDAIKEDLVTFAEATLLIALIKDTATAAAGTLSLDLQDCMSMWRQVRLG
ncbi:hypothetical protein NKR19_g5087 [Coniochaeta hoffmannii]|uniref:Uncharacterized protein n=1 Tax=Coniochaeta hoffmannii TaxID=91930 RepID=A0AA38S5J0_9PEZI|nr:hypothetical protein NKR19_g5087 [Coniochaeta hoffmannii]